MARKSDQHAPEDVKPPAAADAGAAQAAGSESTAEDVAAYVAELEAEVEKLQAALSTPPAVQPSDDVAQLQHQIAQWQRRASELAEENDRLMDAIKIARIAAPADRHGLLAKAVTLKHEAALGHGTRAKGTELGVVIPGDGVELAELVTALRNMELVEVR